MYIAGEIKYDDIKFIYILIDNDLHSYRLKNNSCTGKYLRKKYVYPNFKIVSNYIMNDAKF